MSDDDRVVLQSSDGAIFNVSVKVAKMSETIKNLIEDSGTGVTIPLPNVTGKILAKMVEYSEYHTDNPDVVGENRDNGFSDWDLKFIQVDQPTLFEIILAANYLDIKNLLELSCKTVAKEIKGKNADEVRATFNIKNSFTPEEEEQVRKENEWSEER